MTNDSIAAVLTALAAGQIDAETARIAIDKLSQSNVQVQVPDPDSASSADAPAFQVSATGDVTEPIGPRPGEKDPASGEPPTSSEESHREQVDRAHSEEARAEEGHVVPSSGPVVEEAAEEPVVEIIGFDDPDPEAEEVVIEPDRVVTAVESPSSLTDVANSAGAMLREAGGLAAHTLGRLGRLAGGVLNDVRTDIVTPAAPAASQVVVPSPRLPGDTRKVVVRSVGRRVRIVADPTVATIKVKGPHKLRRSQTTLEVLTEGEIGLNFDFMTMVNPPRSAEDLRSLGFGPELEVRVNPEITVEAEVVGSRLITMNVPHIGRVRVTVGGAKLIGVHEIGDALIQACNATVQGMWTSGKSRVKVESGNLTLKISPDSNVTARAITQLARVAWPGGVGGALDEFVVGDGAANLQLDVVLGRASVRVEN